MALDVVVKGQQLNSCCAVLREKYSKLEEKRNALRQAVKLLEQQIDKFQAENLDLKKAYEEEQARADIEKEGKLKESVVRVTLENEISELKSEISSLQQKGCTGAQGAVEEITLLRAQVSETEMEKNRLKELLEKEKIRADSEMKKAAAEKNKAAEAWKIVKAEKSKADEGTRLADIESKKVEDYRIQLEVVKKEAEEAKSKLVLETAKFEETRKKLDAEKQKVNLERKRADSERVKAEEQKNLAEANRKKSMEEKSRADNLSRLLEEDKQRIEELQREKDKLLSSVKLTDTAKSSLQSEMIIKESDEAKLVLRCLNCKEMNQKLAAEKKKAAREKKQSKMADTLEQRKLAGVHRRMAIEEKHRADQLSQQLEEDRLKVVNLLKKIHELESSRELDEAAALSVDKNMKADTAKMKLLKKKLKFEKVQVKHAMEVAKLEKSRSSILCQEMHRLKQEFIQFLQRVDILDSSFLCGNKSVHDNAKTGGFSNMQSMDLKRNLLGKELFDISIQTENDMVKSTFKAMDASECFRQIIRSPTPLLPTSGGNCIESVSGIDSELEPLLGGSDRKMLQCSGINSSTKSFSDRGLLGSQDGGAFSVTTSAKLVEENLNLQPIIPSLGGEIAKMKHNENVAVVAENSVRSPIRADVVGRMTGHSRKRKRILEAVESIRGLCSKDKKLHLQVEEKLHILSEVLNGHMDQTSCNQRHLDFNVKSNANDKRDRSRKKRKGSQRRKVVMQHLCGTDERKKTVKHGGKHLQEEIVCTQASLPVNNLQRCDPVCNDEASDFRWRNQEKLLSFEEVADGNYIKFLELDDAGEEERYRMAIEMPLSPTLPEIDFPRGEIFDTSVSKSLEERFCRLMPNEDDILVPSHSFDVITVEIDSNKLKLSDTSHNPVLLKCEEYVDSSENPKSSDSGFGNSVYVVKTGAQHVCGSCVEDKMPHVLVSINKEASFPGENDLGLSHCNTPEYCIVFSDIKESSCVSRIIRATRTCIARCSLETQTNWVVQKILLALVLEDYLLHKEKICVFFSLLMHHFASPALRVFGNFLTRESILCLDSFAVHIRKVMFDVETRSIFAELCNVDELINLIEDFLINRRVLVYNCECSESLLECDSKIVFFLDGMSVVASSEAAQTPQLVASSVVLASICCVLDRIGFVCEVSYNVLRMHELDSSLMLTILHVFAYLCGEKYLTLSNYSLVMNVVKSVVAFLEKEKVFVGTAACQSSPNNNWSEFSPCAKCPFSEGAFSVEIVLSMLLETLQGCALSGTMHLMGTVDYLNSDIFPLKEKPEQRFSHEDAACVFAANCDESCCLNKYVMPSAKSEPVFKNTFCDFVDAMSLVELVACKMTWDWTCDKIVPQLLEMMESCLLENFAAAIVVLLGQLGRLGVDAGGYDDLGVEKLRCRLSAFLCCDSARMLGFPVQLATLSSFFGLFPCDFGEFIRSNAELPGVSGSDPANLVRNWFFSLSIEQQSLSSKLFKPSGVPKDQETLDCCRIRD